MTRTINVPEHIRLAAEQGAQLLDQHRPEWWKLIDLDILQLQFGCNCVLGQLYGSFSRGSKRLRVPVPAWNFGDSSDIWRGKAVDLGFHARNSKEWDALTEAWRQIIIDRRKV